MEDTKEEIQERIEELKLDLEHKVHLYQNTVEKRGGLKAAKILYGEIIATTLKIGKVTAELKNLLVHVEGEN